MFFHNRIVSILSVLLQFSISSVSSSFVFLVRPRIVQSLLHLCFQDVWEPVQVKVFKEPVKAIACGGKHSLAVSRKGELFVWGDGSLGQLGLGRIMDVYVPTGIVNLVGVFDVSAGDDYSACLVAPVGEGQTDGVVFAEAGSVWTWGSCEAGKLGHEGLSSGSCVAPKRVRLSAPISKIACGQFQMVIEV